MRPPLVRCVERYVMSASLVPGATPDRKVGCAVVGAVACGDLGRVAAAEAAEEAAIGDDAAPLLARGGGVDEADDRVDPLKDAAQDVVAHLHYLPPACKTLASE